MSHILAAIKHLYIYPVKSMRGVPLSAAHVGLNGIFGDRRYAFVRKELAGADGFPWMTGRQHTRMLLYSPHYERPLSFEDSDPPLLVRTPDGDDLSVADPQLRAQLEAACGRNLMLIKNNRGNYDSQHLSLFSLRTLQMLEMESDCVIDHRQFRANLYLEPSDSTPFAENDWVSAVVQIGSDAVVAITKRDTRCMMINIDPERAVQQPQILRTVAQRHDEQAGVYANVITPGVIRTGDTLRVLSTTQRSRWGDAD